jgi:hypothetical protein
MYDNDICEIEKANLSMRTVGDSFTFSGNQAERERTTRIVFSKSGRVDHLPSKIIEIFPKFTGLSILSSNIPIVRKRLFKPEFAKIQVLWLNQDKIKIVEDEAFNCLTNLVEINLHENRIQSLNSGVFEKNYKLMRINLWDNKIKLIAPGTFQHLNQLKYINLWINECVNEFINSSPCGKIGDTTLQLQNCYGNYTKSLKLLQEGDPHCHHNHFPHLFTYL